MTDQRQKFASQAAPDVLGALESVLFRPQTGYYRDVIEEAAAMFESLVQNHPFGSRVSGGAWRRLGGLPP